MVFFIFFFIECGGMYTAPRGVIHTTNYPQSYDSHSSCTWNIEIAETHLINLTFIDFSTQSSSHGNNDIVLVYDGNMHGSLLLNHSGNSIPPPVISSSNKLLISFEVSKHEFQAKGFKAIYSTVILISYNECNLHTNVLNYFLGMWCKINYK